MTPDSGAAPYLVTAPLSECLTQQIRSLELCAGNRLDSALGFSASCCPRLSEGMWLGSLERPLHGPNQPAAACRASERKRPSTFHPSGVRYGIPEAQ